MPTLRVDDQELFNYTRVAPGEGFDPTDVDFREPMFGDSIIGSGDPLLGVTEHNREWIVPVHLKAHTVAVTNLASDTSGESGLLGGTAGWSQNDAAMLTTNDVSLTHATDGYYAWHVAGTNAIGPTRFPGLTRNGSNGYVPVTAGVAYSMGIDYDCVNITTASKSLHLLFRWYQADRVTSAGADSENSVTLANGSKGRLTTLNKVAPAGAAYANIIAYVTSAVIGEVVDYWLDRFMMVQGATLPAYIDGDKAGCKWDGPRFNATSSTYVGRDGLNELVANVNQTLANAKQLVWRDQGATSDSYYEVQFARFEPEYNYRRSQKLWQTGVVRIFTKPYGSTGTLRQATNMQGTAIALELGIGTYAGDVPPYTGITFRNRVLDTTNLSPGNAFAFAVVPTGYTYEIPAASLHSTHPSAVLITTALPSYTSGTQTLVLGDAAVLTGKAKLGKIGLSPASAYVGRNRVFAIVSAGGDKFMEAIDDDGNSLAIRPRLATGPGVSASVVFGYNVVDLGVLSVPEKFYRRASVGFEITVESPQWTDGDPLLWTGDFSLNRVFVLPENNLMVGQTHSRKLVSWDRAQMQASTASGALLIIDQLGNPYSNVSSLATVGIGNPLQFLQGGLATSGYSVYGGRVSHPTVADLMVEVNNSLIGQASGAAAIAGKIVGGVDRLLGARVHYTTASGAVLNLISNTTGGPGYAAASVLASKSIASVFDFVLNFATKGPVVEGLVANNLGSVVATISASHAAAQNGGQAWIGWSGSGSLNVGRGYTVCNTPSAAIGNLFQFLTNTKVNTVVSEEVGAVYLNNYESRVRGVLPEIRSDYDRVVYLGLSVNHGTGHRTLGTLTLNIEERFSYAR